MSAVAIDGADSEGTMALPSDRTPLTKQAYVLRGSYVMPDDFVKAISLILE